MNFEVKYYEIVKLTLILLKRNYMIDPNIYLIFIVRKFDSVKVKKIQ